MLALLAFLFTAVGFFAGYLIRGLYELNLRASATLEGVPAVKSCPPVVCGCIDRSAQRGRRIDFSRSRMAVMCSPWSAGSHEPPRTQADYAS